MAETARGSSGIEEVRALAEQAGLTLSTEELETFREAVQLAREQLRLLHSIDLQGEEPSFTFQAGEPLS